LILPVYPDFIFFEKNRKCENMGIEILEMEVPAQVDKKGRVTISKNVRRLLGIEEGDFLLLKIKKVE